ncbi:unnamed protein product [Cylicostephanus goldi]|uniref:Uncharacterized protein n=1 Tax=Cylicostephanus goldi TaxID=71465 RepID=A0A3P7QA69_CYLGO|nr:unnamed protein product [Cylicostephanus goldi]
MWSQVLSEWNRRQMPARTTAAMKAAHAKLVRRITNTDATAAARRVPGKGAIVSERPEEAATGLKTPRPRDESDESAMNMDARPNLTSDRTERAMQRRRLEKHFQQLYRKAKVSSKRRPIKRTLERIPSYLMEAGNDILKSTSTRKADTARPYRH